MTTKARNGQPPKPENDTGVWEKPKPRRVAMNARAKRSVLAAAVHEVLAEAHASTYMRHDIGRPELRDAFVAQVVDGLMMPALARIAKKWKPL